MKRLLFLFVMGLTSLIMQAQRCAVLDFQVGTGVTEEDIEGISYEFRSKFTPRGFQMLERPVIIRIIKNLGYDKTDMTQQQVLKVGRNLDATIIVVGTMNKFMDEYSVEIRAIDVSSGRTVASEGANFERTAYRANMQKAALNLVNKMTSKNDGVPESNQKTTTVPLGYVDLGLPSGTIWKASNESGHYTYDEAISMFGNKLPTKEQWEELKDYCKWTWTGNGYKVLGYNGRFIFLPAAGWKSYNGTMYNVGEIGDYFSFTPGEIKTNWSLVFTDSIIDITDENGDSVRLVLNE